MKRNTDSGHLIQVRKSLLYIIVFFTFVGKSSDSLSVNGYIKNSIEADSTGLMTILKQNSEAVFSPKLFSQNNYGLSIDLVPHFTLQNWYDDAVFSKVGLENLILSDSSVTNINYLYGLNASHEFLGKYSDKIGNTYINMLFDRTASVSRFSNSDVKNVGFVLSLVKNEGRYRYNYSVVRNNYTLSDNGGISDSATYVDALELSIFTVPVFLTDAQNSISMTTGKAGNQYLLNYKPPLDSNSVDSVLPQLLHSVGYDIALNREQYVYSMDKRGIDSAFFDTTLVSLDETWDSLGFSSFAYEVYYQLLDSFNRNVFKLSYSEELYDWSVLDRSSVSASFNNYKFGQLSVEASYNLRGLWKEGFNLKASLDNELLGSLLSSASYQVDNNLPGYFFLNYQGNHFNWQNSFERVTNHSLGYSLYHKPSFTGIEGQLKVIDNWVYLDSLSSPVQSAKQIQYFNVGIFNNFKNKHLTFYTKLSYQSSSSEVIRFPDFNLRNVFTYNFKLGRLLLTTGYMFTYFTSYLGLDYNPNLRRTFLQDEKEVGGFPLLDVFASVRIGEANVFVKGENIFFETLSRNYYLYPNRPVMPRYLRVGFSWDFKR